MKPQPASISLLALVVSAMAFVITVWTAWAAQLGPANVIGDLSYLFVWRLSSNNDGNVTDVVLLPAFWLQNVGARPVVIKDVRITFTPAGRAEIRIYPVSSVPLAAIETNSEFNEYGRLSSGSPFRSFGLTKSQEWISSYRFGLPLELLQELVGEVVVGVQISTSEDTEWTTVFHDSLSFGKFPIHLQPMIGSAQSIPIYTRRWSLRGQQR
jgi:hypothetical protein